MISRVSLKISSKFISNIKHKFSHYLIFKKNMSYNLSYILGIMGVKKSESSLVHFYLL